MGVNTNNLIHEWGELPALGFGLDDFKSYLQWAALEIGANDIIVQTGEPLAIKHDGEIFFTTKRTIERSSIVTILSENISRFCRY